MKNLFLIKIFVGQSIENDSNWLAKLSMQIEWSLILKY